jgi:aspartate aminotransferase
MVKQFAQRKEKVLQLVKDIPGFITADPAGAFYIFPDVSYYFGKTINGETINNADELAMYLANKAHVTTVNGKAFGEEKCLRISFANSMQNIEKGFDRIKNALR